MEKIYVELQATKQDMQSGFKELKDEIRKNTIRLDSLEKKVDVISEVQLNHIKQNEENHIDIVEMLSGEIELT